MKKMRKIFLWLYMFHKRLLRKKSFIALLCLIPLLAIVLHTAMQGESGVMCIALCSEDESPDAVEIIDDLLAEKGIILYKAYATEKEAVLAVQSYDADAAWVFKKDFGAHIDAYTAGETEKPFISVYQREETVPLQLAREKLFGAVYARFSYGVYKDFVQTQLVHRTLPEAALAEHYTANERRPLVIQDEAVGTIEQSASAYLTAPLRGMLSVLVLLCGLAAVLYYLKDRAEGKYAWLSLGKHLLPAIASCLAATVLSGIAVVVAFWISGIAQSVFKECIAMVLFVLAVTGFCTCFCAVFRSVGKFGALIPGLLLAALVLSPIFFDLPVWEGVRMLLPTYAYLQSIYEPTYLWSMLFYCVIAYTLAAFLQAVHVRTGKI